jgi:hypothetical protein
MINQTLDWDAIDRAENAAGGLLAGSPGNFKKFSLLEDEWISQAAYLEEGCSVTAGSINTEYFFKQVEENRKLANQILDEVGAKRI